MINLEFLVILNELFNQLTGSKARGWGGKAKVEAVVSGTVDQGDVVQ